MASSRLVFPWALSPWKTLKRAEGSRTTGARLRKPSSWRTWRSTPAGRWRYVGVGVRARSDAHRHDHAHVVGGVGRPDHRGIELARQLEADLLGAHLGQEVDEVLRVEADRERLT